MLLVNACGGQQEGTGNTGEGANGGGNGAVGGGGEGGGEETREEPEQPFAALEPSAEARPISESVSADDTALAVGTQNASAGIDQYADEGTGLETTGDPGPQRSIPLGETLLDGKEDPSNGPLKNNRIVAYYGTPTSDLMGILGEYEPEEFMRLLKEQTQAYSDADPDRPAVPAIEFIATVAQRDPGPDGLYVAQVDPEYTRQYTDLARENDALMILDVQLGRASVMEEVRLLEEFLLEPHVHLAIDTEYAIEEGEVPGINLGSVDGAEIQEAVEYLDGLVREHNLPDKMLMVHQFERGIVTNKEAIQPTENVQVVLHADGFGGAEAKFSKYGLLVRDEPIQYGGFKIFYKQDTPVLEPEQVLALDPAPAMITYQ